VCAPMIGVRKLRLGKLKHGAQVDEKYLWDSLRPVFAVSNSILLTVGSHADLPLSPSRISTHDMCRRCFLTRYFEHFHSILPLELTSPLAGFHVDVPSPVVQLLKLLANPKSEISP
jgi:hypothetical protein